MKIQDTILVVLLVYECDVICVCVDVDVEDVEDVESEKVEAE